MRIDPPSFRAAVSDPVSDARSANNPSCQPLLIDMHELSRLTSLSVRTLHRLNAAGHLPGRVTVGRRVLFQTAIICQWVQSGLPDREQWAALQRRQGKR
jgi:predicted DNA-binding transcriptional regulator AlpA